MISVFSVNSMVKLERTRTKKEGEPMKLYLVQHGLYLSEDIDSKKGLSEKGRTQTQKIAEFLKERGIKVNLIWHSKKERSIQTAEIFREYMPNAEIVQRGDLNPNDPVDEFPNQIQSLQEDLMVVGHLPFLKKLSSLLLVGSENREVVAFKNSGIVCLEYTGTWRILWVITPDLF
ncbi:MAG TPA: phosphohistidine phosphatase SixA [Candidatus Omnitrophica bacterium]|nr:phosphohistidine phosphatase SixA [Candidatus Omnitrophota bacterium]